MLSELQSLLQIVSKSNFNNTIRKHDSFVVGLEVLDIEEVTVVSHRDRNPLAKKSQSFGPMDDASYSVEHQVAV